MSRCYQMDLTVRRYNPFCFKKIQKAAKEIFDFELEEVKMDDGKHAESTVDGNLCAGETEAEFAKRLKDVIFEANGGPCQITLDAHDLDSTPCESFTFGE